MSLTIYAITKLGSYNSNIIQAWQTKLVVNKFNDNEMLSSSNNVQAYDKLNLIIKISISLSIIRIFKIRFILRLSIMINSEQCINIRLDKAHSLLLVVMNSISTNILDMVSSLSNDMLCLTVILSCLATLIIFFDRYFWY